MQTITFSVDSRLLKELGERLVGRPHIALAELIKNAYDADATQVDLFFGEDVLAVMDNGHGMSEADFKERWMRVGTGNKQIAQKSPHLRRTLTGSKGVGRLSAQLLSEKLSVYSRAQSLGEHAQSIVAKIDWDSALQVAELTDVKVEFGLEEDNRTFAAGSLFGTAIVLTGLLQEWDASSFKDLAREIWALQPPFERNDATAFKVNLLTPYEDVSKAFATQMDAILDIATGRITGQLLPPGSPTDPKAEIITLAPSGVSLEHADELDRGQSAPLGSPRIMEISISLLGTQERKFCVHLPQTLLNDLSFEIRTFDLRHRQPRGIRVEDARQYLNRFGGVHIYDSDFHLPYYGVDTDWLRLEQDHARRLSRSQLVPANLQVRNALQDLPSNQRVYGAVRVSTSSELAAGLESGVEARDLLSIQITRDRLVDNAAFAQLSRSVRLALDLYAVERARTKAQRSLQKNRSPRENPLNPLREAATILRGLEERIPATDYRTLADSLESATEAADRQVAETQVYASLLGALATAGMSSLAYEHELSKQRRGLAAVAREVNAIAEDAAPDVSARLGEISQSLTSWVTRSERIRDLFAPLLDEETRTTMARYRALHVANEVVRTLRVLSRGAEIDVSQLPPDLMLPRGTLAAWTALLQNFLTNALRATIEQSPALIKIDGASELGTGWLRVQDNGVGVDIDQAEELFLPFARGIAKTFKAESLGLGGSGLGLTIVRMIASELDFRVAFAQPADGWCTSIVISWKE